MADVLVRDASYGDLSRTVREIFDAFPLDLKNKKVFIKPNLVKAVEPEQATTTHPALLRAIAEEVERRGGRPGIGENGIDVRNLYRVTGIEQACAPWAVNISNAASLFEIGGYQVPISRYILDADVFISVPKLKTHVIAGMTCCLKNNFGLIPGNSKSRMHALTGHAKRLTEFFADLYAWRVPDLHIVDGILAMEGNGPTNGTPKEVGKILAGKDGIAVDSVCARTIGFANPRGIKLIDFALRKGVSKMDPDQIRVDGPFAVVPGYKHPDTYTADTPGKKSSFAGNLEGVLKVWSDLGSIRPASNNSLCTKCGLCPPACPSGAMQLQPYPQVDPEKCLSCFSCVEACPEKALSIFISEELLAKRKEMGM